MTSCCR